MSGISAICGFVSQTTTMNATRNKINAILSVVTTLKPIQRETISINMNSQARYSHSLSSNRNHKSCVSVNIYTKSAFRNQLLAVSNDFNVCHLN